MSIEITENTLGLWFAPADGIDVLAHLSKLEDEQHEFTYRIRVYDDSDPSPFSDKDEKRWKVFRSDGLTNREAVTQIRDLLKAVEAAFELEFVDELLMEDKTLDEFAEEMMSKPWVHTKTEQELKREGRKDYLRELRELNGREAD